MTSKGTTLRNIDEALTSKVRLVSTEDRDSVSESVMRSQKRLGAIIANLNESRLDGESTSRLHEEMLSEAVKLERLFILEGAADKSFFQLQKHFRSMVRAANVLIKWFPDSTMSAKMSQLRTEGIELLSGLYDHIKQLELIGDVGKSSVRLDKGMSQQRDRFMRVFTDFAIAFRGMMTVADMFSEDPTSVGGYNEVKGIFASLEQDSELMDEPLGNAFAIYDESVSNTRNKLGAGRTGLPSRDGVLNKVFGGGKQKGGTAAKFQHAVTKAIASASPGFNKVVPIQDVVQALVSRSLDQLRAYFQSFNDYVAADVDVDFLMQVSQNPRSIGSLFKGVWDALSGVGHMRPLH